MIFVYYLLGICWYPKLDQLLLCIVPHWKTLNIIQGFLQPKYCLILYINLKQSITHTLPWDRKLYFCIFLLLLLLFLLLRVFWNLNTVCFLYSNLKTVIAILCPEWDPQLMLMFFAARWWWSTPSWRPPTAFWPSGRGTWASASPTQPCSWRLGGGAGGREGWMEEGRNWSRNRRRLMSRRNGSGFCHFIPHW